MDLAAVRRSERAEAVRRHLENEAALDDALMLHKHRETLQGRAKQGRGGRSSTMVFSYPFTLCHRAVVATMDLRASNQQCFTQHHWQSDSRNALLLRLEEEASVSESESGL